MQDHRADAADPADAADAPADVAIVGAGGAGLTVVLALDALVAARGVRPPHVVLVDPEHRRATDRTWCFWDDGDAGPVETLLHRRWTRLEFADRAGRARAVDLTGMRYVMLRSAEVYAAADAAVGRLGVRRVTAPADSVTDEVTDAPGTTGDATTAVVRAGGRTIRARWVLDSRPAAPSRPGSTMLLQHFRGWTLRTRRDVFDPALPTLMDFRPPQPVRGVAFGYVLPLGPRHALVEYTEFSPAVLDGDGYDAALRRYLRGRWDLGPGDVEVEDVETGVIPMTDAPFARRAGRRVVRLGTAGGATRPSTGYTFSAMLRQADVVARALLDGRDPLPPPAYPARHRWMDAVLLRALDRGHVAGPEMFLELFARNPPERVLRFLDGGTSVAQDLALMRTSPRGAMLRAGLEDALLRAGRRVSDVRRRAGRAPGPARPDPAAARFPLPPGR